MILLLGYIVTLASQAAEILSPTISQFDLKPLTCVVEKQGQQCNLLINVKWSSNQSVELCFWQMNEQKGCWTGQRVNSNIPISLAEKTLFTLRDKSTNQILAREFVNINFSQPKNFRRRLRADWSIF